MRYLILLITSLTAITLSAQNREESPVAPMQEITMPKMEITVPSVSDYIFAPTATDLSRPSFIPDFEIHDNPYALDFNIATPIANWSYGTISGYGSRSSYPGLISVETGGLSLTQQFGALTLTGSLSANKYGYYRGVQTNYGIHGHLAYSLSDHITLNLFGDYYTLSIYHSPAALPYIGTTRFGGYLGVGINEHVGFDLGMQQQYDPYSRSSVLVPIVRPYYRFNNGITLGADVGWLIKDFLGSAVHGNGFMRGNPTISPPIEPLPPIR